MTINEAANKYGIDAARLLDAIWIENNLCAASRSADR